MCTATLEPPAPRHYIDRQEKPLAAVKDSDFELAQRIRAGDESAFRDLVERHQRRILRVLWGILASGADAEEVAQDVFAKVYFSIRRFDHRGSLLTWIYRIAVNEAYTFLRKRRARRSHDGASARDMPVADVHLLVDGYATLERAVAQRDFVNKLLALIPEGDRVLLLWREVEGCSMTELAELSGLNENTIKVRLFRVRRRLVELAAHLSRFTTNRPCFTRFDLDQDRE
jgi:RNA polymerase sigma-70 factor (ECF subfamily)